MSGPTGVFVGFGTGLTRSILEEPKSVVHIIPVDTVTNLMISLSWFANLFHQHKQRVTALVGDKQSEVVPIESSNQQNI